MVLGLARKPNVIHLLVQKLANNQNVLIFSFAFFTVEIVKSLLRAMVNQEVSGLNLMLDRFISWVFCHKEGGFKEKPIL